ncbi:MAG: anthranilate synthase component I [Magnetococcales bacterium]|nr:anthranilate synthase component I [Magnetococcales bacterium]
MRTEIQPDADSYRQLLAQGNLIPLCRNILADLDTPVSAFLKIAADSPYAFLLESVQGSEKWGRYSLLGLDPLAVFRFKRDEVRITWSDGREEKRLTTDPVAALKEFVAGFRAVPVPGLPRFHGGAVGYFGYDTVRCFERLPDANPDRLDVPDGLFLFPRVVLVFDNLLNTITVVANAYVPQGADAGQVYQETRQLIDRTVENLRRPVTLPPVHAEGPLEISEADFHSEMSQSEFEQAVRQAKEYIAAGDIMQVVLSQRLSIDFPDSPLNLYRALRTTNPSPYLFFLRLGDHSLVGSSPEILVRQEGQTITVRPIAGTRPRGATPEQDQSLEKELLADPKERAEHIMLVDLGRNDLGRVAQTGSVRVTERMVVERYSHVMHIVSNVEATLKPGLDAFDLLGATFPAGTVSGAPKIRAMEIIDELEVSRRGPYAGAVGYVSWLGNMDLAIAIRTAVIKGGRLYIQAGAGIVADSDPTREYEETMNKARAMFRAVGLTRKGLD